jgi:hypothetical protein
MNDDRRRIVLFAVTLAVGLAMVLIDIPVLPMLGLLGLLGLLLLFMTGAVTPADLGALRARFRRRERPKDRGDEGATSAKRPRVSLFRRKEKVPSKDKPVAPLEAKERRPLFAGLSQRLGAFRGRGERRKAAVEDAAPATQRSTVGGSAPPSQGTPAPPTAAVGGGAPAPRESEDPFLSLSDDELQTDLLDDIDSLDNLEGFETPPLDDLPSADAVPAHIDLDSVPEGGDAFEDAAAAILADHANDLEEFTDLEGVDEIDNELASLDETDLSDSELDGLEIDAGEMAALSASSGVDALLAPDAAPVVAELPIEPTLPPMSIPEPKNEMAAFAAGPTGSEGDMLSLLATDVKKVRVKKDLSLLRDLQDVHVGSEDLVTELEDVVRLLGGSVTPEGAQPAPTRHRSSR